MSYAYLLGIVGVTLFAGTLPFTHLAIVDFSPMFITFSRALIAAIPALIWLIATGRKLRHPKNWQIFISGIFLVFAFPGFMAMAMITIPASQGGIVLGLTPLGTAFMSMLIAKEYHSAKFWGLSILGATIVIIFALIKSGAEITEFKIALSTGYLWMFAAAMSASAGYVIAGQLSRQMAGSEVICRSLILTLPIVTTGTIMTWQPDFATPSPTSTIALLYLGLFSMFLGFFAWNTALAIGGIARIAQLQLLQIFITLAISAVLLSEIIDQLTIVTAIVITAILFLGRRI